VNAADRKPAPDFHEFDACTELLHQRLAVIDAVPITLAAVHVDLVAAIVPKPRERHAYPAYRVTVTEQSTTSTATAIRDLQNFVSQQAGDIKGVREILQRIEAGQRGSIERK